MMKKFIQSVKDYFTQRRVRKEVKAYEELVARSKSYCYYSEDKDGNPTIAINGVNVFRIISGETMLNIRYINFEDAKVFVDGERKDFINQALISNAK